MFILLTFYILLGKVHLLFSVGWYSFILPPLQCNFSENFDSPALCVGILVRLYIWVCMYSMYVTLYTHTPYVHSQLNFHKALAKIHE